MLADLPVLHGYTLRDLHWLARSASGGGRASTGGAAEERYEIAWSAMAALLVAAVDAPARTDLIAAGSNAVYRAWKDECHHHGVDRTATWRSGGSMVRFVLYWRPAHVPAAEGRVVDALAIEQIWPHLKDWQRRVLMALAVHGDHQAAAAALGVGKNTYTTMLARARRAFRLHWFAPGVDPGSYGRDRRSHAGAPLDPDRLVRRLRDRRWLRARRAVREAGGA